MSSSPYNFHYSSGPSPSNTSSGQSGASPDTSAGGASFVGGDSRSQPLREQSAVPAACLGCVSPALERRRTTQSFPPAGQSARAISLPLSSPEELLILLASDRSISNVMGRPLAHAAWLPNLNASTLLHVGGTRALESLRRRIPTSVRRPRRRN